MPGRLVLVVGPSGAGKDSLIAAARRALAADPDFAFPRREITRPPGQPGEDYLAVEEGEFARREADGAYCLSWRAHGLAYGVPCEARGLVEAGLCVVVNVSRGVVGPARAAFPRLRVIHVTASSATLAERLRQRGREDDAGIEGRLARAAAIRLEGDDVVELANDGALAQSVAAFVQLLKG